MIYYAINLLSTVDVDGVDCSKRLYCFTQVVQAFISNVLGARKKKEIE
jgi:hypothetical protein